MFWWFFFSLQFIAAMSGFVGYAMMAITAGPSHPVQWVFASIGPNLFVSLLFLLIAWLRKWFKSH